MEPGGWSVLIVDDDREVGRVVASVAERCGFRARVAANARDAWAALEPEPTLLLLDLNLPDTDGLEMLRTLAARRLGAEIRVFSGSDARILRSAAQMGRDLGLRMGEPLGKPLSVAQLMELFAEVARAAASRGAAASSKQAGVASESRVTEDELRSALAAGELFVVFQPILDLETLAPLGAEALVRWRHPVHGLVPPLRFVPLVESSGLAAEMTEQIFGRALAFAGGAGYRWGERPLSISVNVATAALVERDLVALVSARLAASGLAPGRLVVEVTETAMNADRSRVLEVLSRLRLRGVEVSIDDFGTGTSSLERLDQFPCTELKIERAFFSDLLRRPETEAIVRSTLELARRLGLRTVAEGIEDAATWRWLLAAGCDTGQGFLFSKGVEPDEFLAWLAAWEPRRRALLDAAAG